VSAHRAWSARLSRVDPIVGPGRLRARLEVNVSSRLLRRHCCHGGWPRGTGLLQLLGARGQALAGGPGRGPLQFGAGSRCRDSTAPPSGGLGPDWKTATRGSVSLGSPALGLAALGSRQPTRLSTDGSVGCRLDRCAIRGSFSLPISDGYGHDEDAAEPNGFGLRNGAGVVSARLGFAITAFAKVPR